MVWPAKSLHIKVIKHIWRYMKILLQNVVHMIKSKGDLIRESERVWMSIEPTFVQSLYQSIPTRMRCVLRGNGAITKY